jgi:hypothetical protein
MIPIINNTKRNVRLAQWDGKSTCNSKYVTTVLFILFTGMRFALMLMKTGLCHIPSRFEVAPCKETPVRIVFEPKSFVLQMHGEIRLSFNRIQFWNNTHTHTHTNIYVHICRQCILNINTNNHLITPMEKALLEMSVFCTQVGSCNVHYKLNPSSLLERT